MKSRSKGNRTPAALRTMERFVEAAEDIFGRHGYRGTTARGTAAHSGVNLGTLKEYWGSKRAMFRDLMERRLRPIHTATVARLTAVDQRVVLGKVADPGEVVACLVEPAFLIGVISPPDFDFSNPAARGRFHQFFGRCLTDPSPEIVEDLNEMFADITNRFFALMRLACPELTQAELDWRINCMTRDGGFRATVAASASEPLRRHEGRVGDDRFKGGYHFITRCTVIPARIALQSLSARLIGPGTRKSTFTRNKPK